MDDKDPFDFGLDDEEESDTEQTGEAPQVDPREVEDLRNFKAQTEAAAREAAVAAAFDAAGLSPKAGKLWATLNDGEPTPESVRAFAEEYDLPREKTSVGFTPTVIQGGHVPAARTVHQG